MPLLFIELIVVITFVTTTLASQRKDRSRASRGQLPPRPGQPDRAAEAEQHGSTSHKPSPHGTRSEQTRVDQITLARRWLLTSPLSIAVGRSAVRAARNPQYRGMRPLRRHRMTEAQQVRRGYQQFAPPRAPPGMHIDPASELVLPQGVRLASRGQVAAAWFLGLALFSVTLGIGYLTWSLFAWRHGRSPAQRMLSLRCWLPGSRRVAAREQTALRQVTGFCLNGQLLSGFFIWLTGKSLRSAGDFFAGTVILYDPDGVLGLSSAAIIRPAACPENRALS